MSYLVNDFHCEKCGYEFEEIWNKPHGAEGDTPWIGIVECPECGGAELNRLISTPGIAAFSMKDKEGRAESLKKRSREHSKKLIKQNRDNIQQQMNKIKSIG